MMAAMSDQVTLATYRPDLREDFERLNRLWLEGHNLIEPVDVEYLREPERLILADGGQVFFAMQGRVVLGTCAAIRISTTTWELAKLAVEPSARGRGIGRRLCEAVLGYARNAGATEIVLTSHTALVEAIHLYESFGFQHEPMPEDVRYETANVFMRLELS
jgi:ribosomal protein S18 acetylase RimI-like enzyme